MCTATVCGYACVRVSQVAIVILPETTTKVEVMYLVRKTQLA